MYVYRLLTEEELSKWESHDLSMGSLYSECRENSHHYIENTKYVHFFKNIEDAPTILSILNNDVTILCQFDIDEDILKEFEGEGTYYECGCADYGITYVTEYAIPVHLLSRNNLVGYTIVKSEKDIKYLTDNIHWTKAQEDNEMKI